MSWQQGYPPQGAGYQAGYGGPGGAWQMMVAGLACKTVCKPVRISGGGATACAAAAGRCGSRGRARRRRHCATPVLVWPAPPRGTARSGGQAGGCRCEEASAHRREPAPHPTAARPPARLPPAQVPPRRRAAAMTMGTATTLGPPGRAMAWGLLAVMGLQAVIGRGRGRTDRWGAAGLPACGCGGSPLGSRSGTSSSSWWGHLPRRQQQQRECWQPWQRCLRSAGGLGAGAWEQRGAARAASLSRALPGTAPADARSLPAFCAAPPPGHGAGGHPAGDARPAAHGGCRAPPSWPPCLCQRPGRARCNKRIRRMRGAGWGGQGGIVPRRTRSRPLKGCGPAC